MTSPSDNTLVARLREAAKRAKAAVDHDQHEGLTVEFAQMAQYRIDEALTALEASYAENERLREALKPLAECIDRLAPGEDIAHWRLTDVLNHGLTVAHVISARIALKDSPK